MSKKETTTKEKRGKVKVGALKVTKETVKDLSSKEAKAVRGGVGPGGTGGTQPPPQSKASCTRPYCHTTGIEAE